MKKVRKNQIDDFDMLSVYDLSKVKGGADNYNKMTVSSNCNNGVQCYTAPIVPGGAILSAC